MEGNPVNSYEDFMSVFPVLPRPLTLSFSRIFNERQEEEEESVPGLVRNVSEEERKREREARLEAAQKRQNTYKKDRKVRKKSSSSRGGEEEKRGDEMVSAETKRAIERNKEEERRLTSQLGYNPYEPRVVGHNEGRNASMNSQINEKDDHLPSSPSHNQPSPPPPGQVVEPQLGKMEEIEDLSKEEEMLIQSSVTSLSSSSIGLATALKMISNILSNPTNQKFRLSHLPSSHHLIGPSDWPIPPSPRNWGLWREVFRFNQLFLLSILISSIFFF